MESKKGSACRGESGIRHKPAVETPRTVGEHGTGWWQVLRLLGSQPRNPSQPPCLYLMSAACETLAQAEDGDPRMSNPILASEESAA